MPQAPGTKPSERFDFVIVYSYAVFASMMWFFFPAAYIAEDSYFYAVIARNFALTGEQSFNGVMLTNGVHPLWVSLLSAYAWVVSLISEELLYNPAFVTPLVSGLILAGSWFFLMAAKSLKVNGALLTLPVLCFVTQFGLLYSEAHVLYFALSLLLWLSTSKINESGVGWSIAFGVATALVFLARLDSVFLVAAYYVWFWARVRSPTRVAIAGLSALTIALSYLASNYLIFGGLVPISGWMKSSFPHVYLSETILELPTNIAPYGYSVLFGLMPIACALLTSVLLRDRLRGARSIIYVFLVGAGLHAVQILLFATSFTTWYWYYVLPVTLGALALAVLGAELVRRPGVVKAIVVTIVLSTVLLQVHERAEADVEKNLSPMSRTTLQFARANGLSGKVILVSEGPGGISFYTDNRVIAADMLTGNRRFFDAMAASDNALQFLQDYARTRGKPLDYIIHNGGQWLVPIGDGRTVSYRNPKLTPRVLREFGRLEVGPPIQTELDGKFIVWKVSAD